MAVIAPIAARGDLVQRSASGKTVLNAGILAVGAALVLTVVSVTNATTETMPAWPLVIAFVSVALGIPHGAVDHLTLGRRLGVREGGQSRPSRSSSSRRHSLWPSFSRWPSGALAPVTSPQQPRWLERR